MKKILLGLTLLSSLLGFAGSCKMELQSEMIVFQINALRSYKTIDVNSFQECLSEVASYGGEDNSLSFLNSQGFQKSIGTDLIEIVYKYTGLGQDYNGALIINR